MAKRRPPELPSSQSDDFIREGVANLHDVFLNASVQQDRMEKTPVERKPDDLMWFLTSDRGRLERFWIMSLYVLVESWESEFMKPIRERLATVLDLSEVNAEVQRIHADNTLKGMADTRDYMSHRDRRRYWDLGRTAQMGALGDHVRLHDAFGRMLLKAMPWARTIGSPHDHTTPTSLRHKEQGP